MDWDRYDTRHAVYRPAKMTLEALEEDHWRSYRDFYRWGSIFSAAWTKDTWAERLRHLAYAGGWKKAEPLWDLVIRARQLPHLLPALGAVLAGFTGRASSERETCEVRTPMALRSR